MLRRMIFLWICFSLLTVPLSAHAEPLPQQDFSIFYMADSETVWRVDVVQNTAEVLFSVSSMPDETVDSLSDLDKDYLQILRQAADESDPFYGMGVFYQEVLGKRVAGIWEFSNQRLLIAIAYSLCNFYGTGTPRCVGYNRFILLNLSDDTFSPAFTIQFHHLSPLTHPNFLYEGLADTKEWELAFRLDIENLIPNPQRDAVIIKFRNAGHSLSHDRWVWLIDMEVEDGFEQFMNAEGFTWSPDGTRLAFRSWAHCHKRWYYCDDLIVIHTNLMDLTVTTPAHSERTRASLGGFFWADSDVFVYSYGIASLTDRPGEGSGRVVYNVSTGESSVYDDETWPEDVTHPQFRLLTLNLFGERYGHSFFLFPDGTTIIPNIESDYNAYRDYIEEITVDFDPAQAFGENTPILYIAPCYLHAPC
ncbi:MAG TPA: hypothetical protein VHP83_05840 [Aggregatilineaceae bacterium]|nr:hypothetical protein [Aggregatilineaceae bacterium]